MALDPRRSSPAPAAKTPPAAGTVAERAVVLISIMDRLSVLLARELDAIRRDALAEVSALQGEKRDLGARLDEIGRLLRLDRAGMASLGPEVLGRLRDSGARLAQVVDADLQTLDVRAEAQKRVVEVVVKTVNQERRAEAAYAQSRKGFVPKATRQPAGRASTFSATL